MSSLWVAIVSAGAALAGVLLADVRQRGREYSDRLTELRREAFVEVYAWAMKAHEAIAAANRDWSMRLASGGEPAKIDVPVLSHELLARLQIYLDTEIARDARKASHQLSALLAKERKLAPEEVSGRSKEYMESVYDMGEALGGLRALVATQAKALDTTAATRMRWRLRRVIHPPLSHDDPAWSELRLRERFRRRAQELRRPSVGRRNRDPLTQEGLDFPLR
jgi:hypothetical protein